MSKIKILLADDQTLISQSFKIMLETRSEDLEVVGIAENGSQVLELLETVIPDLILMDVRMPVMDGVEAARLVKQRYPEIRVVMLTTYDDDNYVQSAIGHGAAGYLLKDISIEDLIAAIHIVNKGLTLIARRPEAQALRRPAEPPGNADNTAADLLHDLSRKEIDILKQVARGMDNKEIASQFNMAEQSVKNLISRLYQKIGVDNRRDARRLALGLGLIKRDEL